MIECCTGGGDVEGQQTLVECGRFCSLFDPMGPGESPESSEDQELDPQQGGPGRDLDQGSLQ